jgi:hypothetical protein
MSDAASVGPVQIDPPHYRQESGLEIRPVDHRSLAIGDSGMLFLARMSDEEFSELIDAEVKLRKRLDLIMTKVLEPQIDYGIVPGSKKASLLQPGAERMCRTARLAPGFRVSPAYGDGKTTPHISALCVATLYRGSLDGPAICQGIGSANSWEVRYRYRYENRKCPNCKKEALYLSQYKEDEYYCSTRRGGCNSKFPTNDPDIVSQKLGQVENVDPFDLENTIFAQSVKRAFVNVTKRACAASGLFTQDVSENPDLVIGKKKKDAPQQRLGNGTPQGSSDPYRLEQERPQPPTPDAIRKFWAAAGAVIGKWIQDRNTIKAEILIVIRRLGLDEDPSRWSMKDYDLACNTMKNWHPNSNTQPNG